MTDIDALLAAVLRDPADDLPRLAYADCLEERGCSGDADRAEFIRVQIEYARLHSDECACGFVPMPVCDVCRLKSMECSAWNALGNEPRILMPNWRAGSPFLGSLLPQDDAQNARTAPDVWRKAAVILWRRGFADEVRCKTADWKAHGKRLVREHPIRVVKLAGKEPARGYDGEGLEWWMWHRGRSASGRVGPSILPKWIVTHLPAIHYAVGSYESIGEANEALSAACLAYTKS